MTVSKNWIRATTSGGSIYSPIQTLHLCNFFEYINSIDTNKYNIKILLMCLYFLFYFLLTHHTAFQVLVIAHERQLLQHIVR